MSRSLSADQEDPALVPLRGGGVVLKTTGFHEGFNAEVSQIWTV
jgi:hypothetical protein